MRPRSTTVSRGPLNTLFTEGTATGLTDGQLLERFAAERRASAEASRAAEAAFAALVSRHAAMVWGVCRRILRDPHAADDAFQATFLVLVRKCGSVRADDSLGRWLHGVAHRVASRARADAARRESRLAVLAAHAPTATAPADRDENSDSDIEQTISEELDRLPAKYRCAVELCCLQGLTYEQAAHRLNWPVATIKSRLARGRVRLRDRLSRRGVTPSAMGAGLSSLGSSLAPPAPDLLASTLRALTSNATGAVSANVLTLSQGVVHMMAWQKFSIAGFAALLAVGLTAVAIGQVAAERPAPVPPPNPEAPKHQPAPARNQPQPDPRWTRRLSCGATIEVIGISTHPSDVGTWWGPDGKPLDEAVADPSDTQVNGGPFRMSRMVVFRIQGVPENAESNWRIREFEGGSYGQAKLGGKTIEGLRQAVALLPRNAATCTLDFGVANGEWKTIQTWGPSDGSKGAPPGRNFVFGKPIVTQAGTILPVSHDIPSNLSIRLVAIDHAEKEYPAQVHSGGGVKSFTQIVGEFPLAPEQIKEFRVQTREFERIDLPNIALNPTEE